MCLAPASKAGPLEAATCCSSYTPYKMVGHLDFMQIGGCCERHGFGSDQDLGKGDSHEAVEGAPALLDPRAQQRALIGVEQERSQVGRRGFGGDRSVRLGFRDDGSDVGGPRNIKVCQALTDKLALAGEFGAEISQQASAAETLAGERFVQPLEVGTQPG